MNGGVRRKYSAGGKGKVAVPSARRTGATRTRNRISLGHYRHLGAAAGKSLALAGVLGCVIAAFWLFDPQEKLQKFTHRPIKEVQIEGAFQFISSEAVQEQIELYVRDSFLKLDLNDLKRQLEKNPWVDSVTVARVWPDKLQVRIVEQQPIARWGEKGFLNMRGDVVEVEKTTKIQALPFLYGEDRYAQEIMEQYLRIGKMLAQQDMILMAVALDGTRAWTLTLQSGLMIKLGRDRLWEKLQYLVAAKSGELGKDFHKIQLIDMRYPSGFAVTWKDTAEQFVAGG